MPMRMQELNKGVCFILKKKKTPKKKPKQIPDPSRRLAGPHCLPATETHMEDAWDTVLETMEGRQICLACFHSIVNKAEMSPWSMGLEETMISSSKQSSVHRFIPN